MADKTLELQIRIAAEEAARIVSALKGEVKGLADEAGKFAKSEGEALKQSFKEAENAAKDTSKSINDIFRALGSLADVAAAAKALSFIKDMGAFALQTADNFQTAKNQFGILLGDMEAGAGLFNEIKAFNDVTPFDLDTLTQATNVLVAAKVPLADLQNQLTKFGDLSQGNSQKLTSYIHAFSMASAKGKADMQVLNTYLNQGVPILDALANNFNVTTAEIMEMSSKGQISFSDFSKALDDLTAAGGQYFGGMELASQSLTAMQEGLSEAVNTLAASFGDMLMPAAIAVVSALTEITNAINESPLLKGLLTAAIVAITGYLAAMAIKAGVAFAAQMSLNFAIGALNPVVLASTIAVAGLAAGYTAMAAKNQNAAREAENAAYQQRKQKDAINDAADAVIRYTQALQDMTDEQLRNDIKELLSEIENIEVGQFRILGIGQFELEAGKLEALYNTLAERRTKFIETMLAGADETKVKQINEQLDRARKYLTDPNPGSGEQSQLQAIINNLNQELSKILNKGPDINKMASDWKKAWAEVYGQFQADQANNPFYQINLEQEKKQADAYNNYIRSANTETLDQINTYYAEEREKIIRQLADEEKRLAVALSKTKIDDLEYQKSEELKALAELEQKRIFSAEYTGEEIAAIQKSFEDMRNDIKIKYDIEIETEKLAEARALIKDFQQELSGKLALALMDLKGFSLQGAIVIGDLAASLANLSASAALSGFEEFGRALGEGEDAAESMSRALAAMGQQILNQLPMLFLQAGLQLIASGQWPMGLAFIAAAGASAITAGFVDGKINRERASKEANEYAKGGVFDEYGQAARAFAAGGTFTNQIVSAPTHFRYGDNFDRGLMGEEGPEAIMPLTRMPNGDLGVQTSGKGSSVVINVYTPPGTEVRKEETEGADGSRQFDIYFGDMFNRHVASGKADRVMAGRYGSRPVGV